MLMDLEVMYQSTSSINSMSIKTGNSVAQMFALVGAGIAQETLDMS